MFSPDNCLFMFPSKKLSLLLDENGDGRLQYVKCLVQFQQLCSLLLQEMYCYCHPNGTLLTELNAIWKKPKSSLMQLQLETPIRA